MKRAIIWFHENAWPSNTGPGFIVGSVIALLFSTILGLCFTPGPELTWHRFLIGEERVIGGSVVIGGAIWGYRALIDWARDEKKVIKPHVTDPLLEAARREVEEIAPDV